MKALYLGSNEKKNGKDWKNKEKIEARFAKRKKKMNSLNIKC